MGFRVSLYAIFDRDIAQIHDDLNLRPTGQREEFPDSPIAGAAGPSGAYLLYVNDRDVFGEDLMRPLTRSARVLACNVNETVMYSAVAGLADGREIWSVVHDANQGLRHLEAAGDVPERYASIREAKLAEQAADEGADCVFDVPVELFVQLGGIRYDQDIDSDDPQPWQSLEVRPRPKRRWWPFGGARKK